MKDSRIKNILRGLAIIAFAVCLLLSKSNIITDVPMVRIAICIIMGLWAVEQIIEKQVVGASIPLGVIACLFREEIGFGNVNYALIMFAFILIGVGLSFVFGKKPHVVVEHNGKEHIWDGHGASEYWEEDGVFDLDNSLGSKTQYLTIHDLKKGSIDNALGSMKVYFNGTTVHPDGAVLDIDNGMGSLSIYFPKEFRVAFNCENGMGKINMHGEGSEDMSQPLIRANIDNGMGQTDIYFE
jgi:hypothetical protein